MRTKTDIYNDMSAAIMTAYSTDHSRALSGAEWLQQLASELVGLIKVEQFKPLADAFDEQESPGDGWRWLEPGEVIQRGDQLTGRGDPHDVIVSIASTVGHDEVRLFRRRI